MVVGAVAYLAKVRYHWWEVSREKGGNGECGWRRGGIEREEPAERVKE